MSADIHPATVISSAVSGARLVATAVYELQERKTRYALATMCIGVGQGIAALIERA